MSQKKTLKVLVVDDEKVVRDVLVGFLSLIEAVAKVKAVEDGLKAIEAVKEEKFDVVFLDARMPKMSGWETFNEFRKINSDMFCVFMTGYASEDALSVFMTGYASEDSLVAKMKSLGTICLKKPFEDFNQIREIINNVLEKSQG